MSLSDTSLLSLVGSITSGAQTLADEVKRLRNLYEPPTPAKLKSAIPTYFYPGTLWGQLTSDNCSIAIINPASGPGNQADPNYVNTVKAAQAKGIKVLGYVTSSYAQKTFSFFSDEVNRYFSWYHVDGIFIDEASTSVDSSILGFYATAFTFIKNQAGFVVLNPGTLTSESYIKYCDLLINFEAEALAYSNFKLAGWETKYPASKFWHLIHTCSAAQLPTVMAKAKTMNAGYVYATPDTLPNPWDTLPSADYWNTELSAR